MKLDLDRLSGVSEEWIQFIAIAGFSLCGLFWLMSSDDWAAVGVRKVYRHVEKEIASSFETTIGGLKYMALDDGVPLAHPLGSPISGSTACAAKASQLHVVTLTTLPNTARVALIVTFRAWDRQILHSKRISAEVQRGRAEAFDSIPPDTKVIDVAAKFDYIGQGLTALRNPRWERFKLNRNQPEQHNRTRDSGNETVETPPPAPHDYNPGSRETGEELDRILGLPPASKRQPYGLPDGTQSPRASPNEELKPNPRVDFSQERQPQPQWIIERFTKQDPPILMLEKQLGSCSLFL